MEKTEKTTHKSKAEKKETTEKPEEEAQENIQEKIEKTKPEETKIEKTEEDDNIIDKSVTFKELGLCDELCEAVKKLGFKHPSKIQKEALPYAMKGKDIIGLAETGSGKTAAFALPVLQDLLNEQRPFFCLVMSPTRELCIQIAEQFEAIGADINLKTSVLVGGLDMMAQAISLAKKPHVIVGTPGRVADHLANTKGFNLKHLKYLIFDEADRLLNLDFEKQINQILSTIPKKRRTFLFSATMTSKVHKLQRASLVDPVKIEVSDKYQTVSTLIQNYHFLPNKYKEVYLVYLLTEFSGKKIMVFNNTCMAILKMTLMLRNLGFDAVALSGNLTQTQRIGALNKFKSGGKILIATDVANRGLDIPSVDLVINSDIPANPKDYIHRVGRTARGGKSGRAVTLVTQYDVENFQKIEHLTKVKMSEYPIKQDEALIFYERVIEAQRLANLEVKTMDTKKGFVTGSDMKDSEEADQSLFSLAGKKRKGGKNFQSKSFARKRRRN
ncbi:unnamed protein product [Moneuplotes crassus]|uniref:Uncharacterized protein n=1 Tax=Euplotes crassus TaxID=5936 RepID=A0AAD1UBS7_EUPCR|nr:unnamed protein product [Moneuplotes crassus]